MHKNNYLESRKGINYEPLKSDTASKSAITNLEQFIQAWNNNPNQPERNRLVENRNLLLKWDSAVESIEKNINTVQYGMKAVQNNTK